MVSMSYSSFESMRLALLGLEGIFCDGDTAGERMRGGWFERDGGYTEYFLPRSGLLSKFLSRMPGFSLSMTPLIKGLSDARLL